MGAGGFSGPANHAGMPRIGGDGLEGYAVLRCESAGEHLNFARSGCNAIDPSFPLIGTETQQRCDIAGLVEFLIVFDVEQFQTVT
jgi:hypothetical protein